PAPPDAERVAARQAAGLGDARRPGGVGGGVAARRLGVGLEGVAAERAARRRARRGSIGERNAGVDLRFAGVGGVALAVGVGRDAHAPGVLGEGHAVGGGVPLGPGL